MEYALDPLSLALNSQVAYCPARNSNGPPGSIRTIHKSGESPGAQESGLDGACPGMSHQHFSCGDPYGLDSAVYS